MVSNLYGMEESPSSRAARMVLNPYAMIAARQAFQITEQLNFTKNLIYPPHVQAIIEQQNAHERIANPYAPIIWGAGASGILLRTEAKTDTQQREADNRKSRDEAEYTEIITTDDSIYFETLCSKTGIYPEPNESPEVYYSRLLNSIRAKERSPKATGGTKLKNQQEAIVKEIKALNFDQLNVPDGEKKTIEVRCRKYHPHLFNKANSFSVAWNKGCPQLFKSVSYESRIHKGKFL